jgi:nucleotide-binding universal stress UspA family protein
MTREEMQMLRVSEMSYEEKMKQNAEKSRSIIKEMLKEHDCEGTCEIMLREGKPKQEIVKYAEENDFDLIVMTSNGRSNLQEQLMGSVAEYVVRYSKVHVLVVKEAAL